MSKRSLERLPERKLQDKLWRPCQDSETASPVGKLCNHTCVDRGANKCKEWKTIVKDFSDKEEFLFFRNGTFVMIDEDELF